MSRIYAAGVKLTALANIAADLEDYFSTNAAGELVLDKAGLEAYLREELLDVAATEFVDPATAETATAAAQLVNIAAGVTEFDNRINVAHFSQRADWPTTTSAATGAAHVSAVKAAMDECRRLAENVTLYYRDIDAKLESGLIAKYDALGIAATLPPTVERQVITRAAFYTYVTDRGEESAPSPASELADMDQNDTATYTATAPPSGRNIATIRWYRSRSTNLGFGAGFVADVAYDSGTPATLTYLDEKKDEELGEPCPTITWAEPPSDLVGLTEGPNGGMGGFIYGGNTACFCENFHGYAWPEEYRKTTAWPITAVGRFDQTYVFFTRGKPYYGTGADSASIDWRAIDSNQSCVSKRSVVSTPDGVLFASPDGICVADASGVRVISEAWFDRETWQALTPSSIFAVELEGCYVFSNGTVTYSLNLKTGKLTTVTDQTPTAFFRDLGTDTLYYAQGTTLKSAFTSGSKRTGTWKSKKIEMPRPANLAWLQVQGDFESNVTVKLYRDGTLTDTKTVSSRTPVRLSSKHAIEHEVQVESAAKTTRVLLTSTSEEMRRL